MIGRHLKIWRGDVLEKNGINSNDHMDMVKHMPNDSENISRIYAYCSGDKKNEIRNGTFQYITCRACSSKYIPAFYSSKLRLRYHQYDVSTAKVLHQQWLDRRQIAVQPI